MKNKEEVFKRIIELCLIILIGRLFYLQILNGDFYNDLAEKNYLKFITLPAPRGIVYDRNGVSLVKNEIKYSLYLVPPYEKGKNSIKKLSEIIGMEEKKIEKIFEKVTPFYPAVLLKENLTPKEIVLLEENRDLLPSFSINVEFVRSYPFGDLGAHVLGYMGEVSKEELQDEESNYSLGEKSGKFGIEASYEKVLRGEKGFRGISLYTKDKKYVFSGQKDPVPGNSLVLSLDIDLQKVVEEALGDEIGSVIVSNPWTGEVLAMASHPSFDPNKFISGFSKTEWESFVKDPNNPLNNRAISSLYAPGSIFKLVVSLAALENRKVSEKDTFFCPGVYRMGKYVFKCWKKDGHGKINFINGIASSCNVVFYNVGLRVGEEEIFKFAKKFFLDSKTGIDIPGEVKGFIPSKKWKEENLKEPWYPGDTINLSIGQGFVLVTPLEIHSMVSMIATEGRLYKPHLVKRILNPTTLEEKDFEPELIGKVDISKKTWEVLKEGMEKVIEEGTGTAARIPGIKIAGKTGTAENPHGESHAWFSAFSPAENPQYVVTVFLEHGKSGGGRAAPIAKKIMEFLLKEGK